MKPTIPLDYGAVSRRNPWRVTRRFVGGLVLLMACVLALRAAYERLGNYQYYRVRGVLVAAVPQGSVDIHSIDGKVISATVTIDRTGTKVFQLDSPRAEDLGSESHLHIEQIGPYVFIVITPEGQRMVGVDLGTQGEFANLLPFELRSVRDFVARYDEVVGIIEKLPTSGKHTAKDGRTYEYEIRRR
jgi:hypothetical protein